MSQPLYFLSPYSVLPSFPLHTIDNTTPHTPTPFYPTKLYPTTLLNKTSSQSYNAPSHAQVRFPSPTPYTYIRIYNMYYVHILYCICYVLYTIHYTLYTIHYTLNTIHYTLYTKHYTLYTIHFILYTLYYTLYTIHYILTSNPLHRSTSSLATRWWTWRQATL
jgi:hypothetical protein